MNTVKISREELVTILRNLPSYTLVSMCTNATEKLVGKKEMVENGWKKVTKLVIGEYHINFDKNNELLASIDSRINLTPPSWQDLIPDSPLASSGDTLYLRVMPERTKPQYQIDGKFSTAKVLSVIRPKISPKPKTRGMHFVFKIDNIRWIQIGETKYQIK